MNTTVVRDSKHPTCPVPKTYLGTHCVDGQNFLFGPKKQMSQCCTLRVTYFMLVGSQIVSYNIQAIVTQPLRLVTLVPGSRLVERLT
jgi:hypothetical protein